MMRTKRGGWVLASLTVIALGQGGGMSVAAGEAAGGADEDLVVRLAVSDAEGLDELKRDYGPFVDLLEAESGLTVEFYPVTNRTVAAAALEAEQVDIVLTGPSEYVVMHAATGAVPIVAIKRLDYHSCIYTRADSGITDVAQLVDARIGLGDVGSTSEHLGIAGLLADAGIDPLDGPELIHLGDVAVAHEALTRGDLDAVGIECATYKLTDDEENLDIDAEEFPLLAEGPILPPDVFVAARGVDPAAIEAFQTAFEENFDGLIDAMRAGDNGDGTYSDQEVELVPALDSDYEPIREMYRLIGIDDFDEFVGDD